MEEMVMRRQGREMRSEAESGFGRACRALRSFVQDEAGVTAIEYALLGALIVIVVVTGIAASGSAVLGMWTRVSDAVTRAV